MEAELARKAETLVQKSTPVTSTSASLVAEGEASQFTCRQSILFGLFPLASRTMRTSDLKPSDATLYSDSFC